MVEHTLKEQQINGFKAASSSGAGVHKCQTAVVGGPCANPACQDYRCAQQTAAHPPAQWLAALDLWTAFAPPVRVCLSTVLTSSRTWRHTMS